MSRKTMANDMQAGGNHYHKFGKMQPWDILKVYLTKEQFTGYMLGTAINYSLRANHKGTFSLDVRKAMHTLMKLSEEVEDDKI